MIGKIIFRGTMAYKFVDIDLSFKRHPGTHDVLKKYDIEAVKTALRNIFLYDKYEKPFDPTFGVNARSLLFESLSPALTAMVQKQVQNQIAYYEPRCVIDNLKISDDNNDLNIELYFHVTGYPSTQTVNIVVERVR